MTALLARSLRAHRRFSVDDATGSSYDLAALPLL